MWRRLARAAPWLVALLLAGVQYRFLFADLMQCSRDLYGQHFPETWFLLERLRQGALPMWLPGERMGQPFMALLYTQVLYLPRVLTALWGGAIRGPNWMHAFHALFAFSGCFMASRRLGLSRWAAFVSAALFGLGPAFVVFSENLQFAASASWAGWSLWAALRVRAVPEPRRVAVLALMITGAVLAGAPEMVIWQGVMVVLVCGARGVIACVWSGLCAAVVLLPAAEMAREFTEPGSVPSGQLEWSTSFAQLWSLAVPDADRPREGGVWETSDQWFLASLFVGTAAVIFAAASVRRRRARPLLILAAICALLCLGHNFALSELVLQLPVLRSFRYPAKYTEGLLFAISMLAGVGVQRLRAMHPHHRWPFAAGAFGVVLGLFAASRAFEVRSGFTTGAAWALCVGLFALVLLLRVRRPFAVGAAVLVGFELLVAPRQPLVLCTVDELTASSPIAARLRAENVQRVSVWVDRDDDDVEWCWPTPAATVVRESRRRLSSLRYLEEGLQAIGGYGFRDPWRPARAFEQGETAYALAGVTHLVMNTWESPDFEGPTLQGEHRPPIDDVWVWRTREPAFPRAWLVTSLVAATDSEALAALRGSAHRFRREVLADAPGVQRGECASPAVTLSEPRPEVLIAQIDACDDGYLVLADAWYPGWVVSIDGAAATGFRADFFLRGVAVPKGRHEVRWEYHPRSMRLGAWLSVLGLGAMGVFGLRRRPFGRARA